MKLGSNFLSEVQIEDTTIHMNVLLPLAKFRFIVGYELRPGAKPTA